MHYQDLLFDLDETLFDFKACEQRALNVIFERYKIAFTAELMECYSRINHHLWREYEFGNVTREEVLNQRFRLTFQELGIEDIADSFEEEYQNELANGAMMKEGALEVVKRLSENHRLYVVSNGVASTQYARLHASGLYPFFKAYFISEEVGYQKPQIEFMEYVKTHIPNFDETSVLLIGDSEASDIQGAVNLGIHSCIIGSKSALATYQINSLEEIFEIVD